MNTENEEKPSEDHEPESPPEDIRESIPGASIVARIRAERGISPHVVLRGLPEDEIPVDDQGGERSPSELPSVRYEVLEEIARGGVGMILKSRDVDLGREVAMKVLLSRHSENNELLRRFVEEAQVAGQLQHPGIVPVYEIGLQEDGRPYFAMKLVKGKTLAAMIQARAAPAENRRRLLGIFEQVCQAMAYAHARGVIHRDLKPSNVMVGAFGEVQIVDWGFAKVLHETEGGVERPEVLPDSALSIIRTVRSDGEGAASIAGSVLGTPAYMPPEQALGQIDRVDERSDVFSLGSMLLEILTGRPVYAEREGNLLVTAARHDVGDALERLEESDANRELKEIVRRCLSAAPDERPANAGELAELIGDHLASVEDRARRMQLAAAEAKVKAREERRRRKLTLLLAGAVLLAVLAGGAIFFVMQRSQRDRIEQAARSVDAALSEASLLRGEARAAGIEGLDKWPEVLGAAERAARIAESSGAAPEARERVEAFRTSAAEEQAALEAAARKAAEEKELTGRLVTLRLEQGEGKLLDPARKAERYAETLGRLGIDVSSATTEKIVEAVRESSIRDEILPALDDYVLVRIAAGAEDEGETDRFREALKTLDPDPRRTEARVFAWKDDRDGLRKLTQSEDLALEDLNLLGELLLRRGDWAAAAKLIPLSLRKNPAGFWPNFRLGYALMRVRPWKPDEAEARYGTALAADPDAVAVKFHLAVIHWNRGNVDEVLAQLREVHERDPGFRNVAGFLGNALVRKAATWIQGEFKAWEAAAEELREATRVMPDKESYHRNLAYVLINQVPGYWHEREGKRAILEEAIAACEKAIELNPDGPQGHQLLGQAKQRAWDLVGAIGAFEEAARLDTTGSVAASAYGSIALCHNLDGDIEAALPWSRKAVERARTARLTAKQKESYERVWIRSLASAGRPEAALAAARKWVEREPHSATARNTLGIRLGALRMYEEAGEAYREAAERDAKEPVFWSNLGLASAALGDLDGARQAFSKMMELEGDNAVSRIRETSNTLVNDESYEAALFLKEELVRREPDKADNHIDLAWVYAGLGRPDDAMGALARARDLDAGLRRLEMSSYQIPGEFEDLGTRVERCRQSARERPEDLTAQLQAGWMLHARKDYDGAEAHYLRAIALDPERALTWLSLAVARQGRRDWRRAAEATAEYAKRMPEDATGHAWLSYYLSRAGEEEKAVAAAREAIRLEPTSSSHRNRVAWAHFRCGSWEKGLAYLREARLVLPRGADSHISSGESLLQDERYAPAQRLYRDFLANVREDDPRVRAALGRLLCVAADPAFHDPEEGLALCRKAIEARPDETPIIRSMGVALVANGRPGEALEPLLKVLEKKPKGDLWAWIWLARAKLALGEKDAAREWAEKAREWLAENTGERMLEERWMRDLAGRLDD